MKNPVHLLNDALYAMKDAVQDFLGQRKMQFFEWLSVDRNMPCHAFGGAIRHKKLPGDIAWEVRVCTKNRWHTDSHAYEFVNFPYKLDMED